jgi:hypothetical protein
MVPMVPSTRDADRRIQAYGESCSSGMGPAMRSGGTRCSRNLSGEIRALHPARRGVANHSPIRRRCVMTIRDVCHLARRWIGIGRSWSVPWWTPATERHLRRIRGAGRRRPRFPLEELKITSSPSSSRTRSVARQLRIGRCPCDFEPNSWNAIDCGCHFNARSAFRITAMSIASCTKAPATGGR